MTKVTDLPDELIRIIFSLLPAKSAALTTIQSKKLLNLITIERNLFFDQSKKKTGETFQSFVNGLSNRPACDRIRRLSLKLQTLDDKSQFTLVNDCLCNVLKRGIIDLELDINVKDEDDYLLPNEVFACKTIEKLKLGSGFVINKIPNKALLPALKTLILDTVRFDDLGSDCAFQKLLNACPVIDELVINGFNWINWKWSRSVSSQTLKRLITRRKETDFEDLSESDTMSFDTPNLTYLEYSDILLYEYPIVNLDSIVEAKLSFDLRDLNDYKPMNLMKGLKNVEILRLNAFDAMELLFYDSSVVPVFEKLIHISIKTEPTMCWYGLRVLLERSPNLKTLTLEGTLHYTKTREPDHTCECLNHDSYLLTYPIEVMKITEFHGSSREMVQVRRMLEKSPHPKVLELRVKELRQEQQVQIMKDLNNNVSSSNCIIRIMPS